MQRSSAPACPHICSGHPLRASHMQRSSAIYKCPLLPSQFPSFSHALTLAPLPTIPLYPPIPLSPYPPLKPSWAGPKPSWAGPMSRL